MGNFQTSRFWLGTTPEDVVSMAREIRRGNDIDESDLIVGHILSAAYGALAGLPDKGTARLSELDALFSMNMHNEVSRKFCGEVYNLISDFIDMFVRGVDKFADEPVAYHSMCKLTDMHCSNAIKWVYERCFTVCSEDQAISIIRDNNKLDSVYLDVVRASVYGYKYLICQAIQFDGSTSSYRSDSAYMRWLESRKMSPKDFTDRIESCKANESNNSNGGVGYVKDLEEIYDNRGEILRACNNKELFCKIMNDVLTKFAQTLPSAVQNKLSLYGIVYLYIYELNKEDYRDYDGDKWSHKGYPNPTDEDLSLIKDYFDFTIIDYCVMDVMDDYFSSYDICYPQFDENRAISLAYVYNKITRYNHLLVGEVL